MAKFWICENLDWHLYYLVIKSENGCICGDLIVGYLFLWQIKRNNFFSLDKLDMTALLFSISLRLFFMTSKHNKSRDRYRFTRHKKDTPVDKISYRTSYVEFKLTAIDNNCVPSNWSVYRPKVCCRFLCWQSTIFTYSGKQGKLFAFLSSNE